MIVYHGSVEVVSHPDVSFSKRFLDFGPGFYLTAYRAQAEKWARRKALRSGKQPVLNVYSLSEDWSMYETLVFPEANTAWLDFVCACRRGDISQPQFDLVRGKVADDDVFKTVDLYFRGIWNQERTLQELRFAQPNDQIAILRQNMLDKELVFQNFMLLEKESC